MGVEIDVRVIPRAKKNGFAGTRDGALVIRLAAPPVDNAANEALIELLSEAAGVPAAPSGSFRARAHG